MIAYWIADTLRALPAVLWMVLGLGLPYALAALPRRDWRDYPLVAMCALAFGPALVTAWMFVLGTLGGIERTALLTAPNILLGTLVLALIGAALAWRKRDPVEPFGRGPRLAFDERLLIALIAAALVLRWFTTSYWPFISYDPLWVYGYQGRLYSLQGFISPEIGYYPPFLSLQYVYTQVMTGIGINDHVARAVLPFLHLGAVLATYSLGRKLFSRRVGLIAAALWALYPHVGQWAHVGDLEIPLTFAFTGAAAFFLTAWTASARRDRLHYAALSGLFLGVTMWTKPTGGAFIMGVVLLVTVDTLQRLQKSGLQLPSGGLRGLWAQTRNHSLITPRFELAAVTGLASIPLGALWYLRNIAYGHDPITLPHPYWLTQAMRSGVEFGWPLLALGLLVAFVLVGPLRYRPNRLLLLGGFAVVIAALLPSMLPPRSLAVPDSRMLPLEWAVLALGLALMAASLWPFYRRYATPQARRDLRVIAWALLLALPYFGVWFVNYSYHYRLSFAIVPLMLLPTALIVARWITAERVRSLAVSLRWSYALLLAALAIPGIVITLYSWTGGWDWLWSGEYPTDFNRLEATNVALAWTVKNLEDDIAAQGLERAVILAPGLQRMPFFFPLHDVRILDTPTDLDALDGVDYFVYTQEARWLYEENGLPESNPVTGAMQRPRMMSRLGGHSDISFFSRIYRVNDPARRFRAPRNVEAPDAPVIFGDFARLYGHTLNQRTLNEGDPARLRLVWEVLGPAELSYTIYVHLLNSAGEVVATWDTLPLQGEFTHYPTTVWEAGEYVVSTRRLELPPDLPPGDDYRLVIGMYDFFTPGYPRVSVTIGDGAATTDGYLIAEGLRVLPTAENRAVSSD